MAILEFTGARTRDAYPELRRDHLDYCLRDIFALCVAAARDCHEALAETLTAVHAMHRARLPRIAVNFNQLIMAIEAGDGDDAEAMVLRSKNGPRIDGALSGDRDLVRQYVLRDTRPAIALMMEQGLSDPDDRAYLRNMVEEKRLKDMKDEIADILARHYKPPGGNELHAAINAALAAAGLEPYADKAAPVPPRGSRPALTLVRPG